MKRKIPKISVSLVMVVLSFAIILHACKKDFSRQPAVVTERVDNTQSIAYGKIVDAGSGEIYDYGFCWDSVSTSPTSGASSLRLGKRQTTGTFQGQLTGLNPSKTYHLRAFLTSETGVIYGKTVDFTTPGLPAIITSAVTNITQTTATSGGNVTSDGGAAVTARGVCWSTSHNPTTSNFSTTNGGGTGSFISNLTGLITNTPYYIRAYATNSAGTSYGNEISLKLANVTFSVDMTKMNLFDPLHDAIYIAGDFEGNWFQPGTNLKYIMSPLTGDEMIYTINLTVNAGNYSYKFFRVIDNVSSWDYGEWDGHPDRTISVDAPLNTTVPWASCPGIPFVTYNGIYYTVQIMTQCWFKENLNIGTRKNGSINQTNDGTIEKYCYNDNEANCNIYGGLYQWNEAMNYSATEGFQGICPSGWHLPSNAEWDTLTNSLWGADVAGGKMKEAGMTHWSSPNTGATNSSGFTGLPDGDRGTTGYFFSLNQRASFWSSSQDQTSNARARHLRYDYENIVNWSEDKNFGFSVRCILNK